jgi:hypothetical protein
MLQKYLFSLPIQLLLFSTSTIYAQIKLDTISILEGRVKLLAPAELSQMSDEMWNFKYQKKPRPLMVLTDEDAEINLIAHMTPQHVLENQLEEFKDIQIEQLKQKLPDIFFLDSGVKLINGKNIGYFKFISQAIDQKVFNYFFFTIVDEKILLFTFNCIEKLKPRWQDTADKIVASLIVKS